jgi:trimeric autotransporter adhesin
VAESESFSYVQTVTDEMSAPLHAEAAAVDDLTTAVKKNDAALQANAQAQSVAGQAAATHGGLLRELFTGLVPQISLAELLTESVKKVGEAIVETVEKLGELAFEGVKFALEASEFKENMVSAFSVVKGTAEEGEAAFAAVERIAIASHAPVEASEKLAQELALAGEKNTDNIAAAVAAASSLNSLGLQGGAEELARVLEQSESIGHFQLPKKLQGLGVSVTDLTADLARRLHTTTDVITQQLKAGKIATEVGVAALLDQINQGRVGQAAAKKFDLSDILTDWHNFWFSLAKDVDSSPLTQGLHDFVSAFDEGSSKGATMKDVLVEAFNAVIRWTGAAVTQVTIWSLEAENAFLEVAIALHPAIRSLEHMYEEWEANTAGASRFEPLIRLVADSLVRGATAADFLLTTLFKLHDGAAEAGKGISDGLSNGIADGMANAVRTAHALGDGVKDAIRAALQIHSPSAVTKEFGAQTAEGFELGVAAGGPAIQGALGDMIAPPSVGSAAGQSVASAPSISITWTGDVVSHGNADAHEVAELVESKFSDVVERIVLELGG